MSQTAQPPQTLISAGERLLQPGTPFFRITDALGAGSQTTLQVDALTSGLAAANANIATLQGQVATLQSQVSTLQAQVQSLQLFQRSFDYQQVEISTGITFLDQRTIYRRSIVLNTALNTALNNFVQAHGIASISYIVDIQAMAAQAGAPQYPITFLNMVTAPSLSTGLSIWADTTNIIVSVGSTAFAGYQTIATLWYTCTDR